MSSDYYACNFGHDLQADTDSLHEGLACTRCGVTEAELETYASGWYEDGA